MGGLRNGRVNLTMLVLLWKLLWRGEGLWSAMDGSLAVPQLKPAGELCCCCLSAASGALGAGSRQSAINTWVQSIFWKHNSPQPRHLSNPHPLAAAGRHPGCRNASLWC
jgi:hypothetical protein